MEFWRFQTADPALGTLLVGHFEPVLVALSVVIACFAGVTALALADRMTASTNFSTKAWWHVGGAFAMGSGIWSMHFTGMLAFSIPQLPNMTYDAGLTLMSLFPGILGSAAALYFIANTNVHGLQLQLCALLMAAGIGTMHYTGMEAMRMKGLRYDFTLFVLSIVVAHLLALAALSIRANLRRSRRMPENVVSILAGSIMGLAVAGMHYTAMSASLFYEMPGAHTPGSVFSHGILAGSIGAFAGVILGLSVMAAWIDRQIGFERLLHLEKMAHTDALTGLPNRVLFQDQLQAARDHSARHGDRFGLLFIDLNKFKPINDTLGHAAGDRVLREVAARIRKTLRGEDAAARLGGDEFVILVRDLEEPESVVEVAERLLRLMQASIALDKRELTVGASIGISICPDDGLTAEELKGKADAAMYRAKTEGLGYCFANSALAQRAAEQVRFGRDLREALEGAQLQMQYQPWVDLESRRWLGLEALARWVHPQEGDIAPSMFIPLAERCGLIWQFGAWSLRAACTQGRAWLDAEIEFGRIAVNLGAAYLAKGDFVEQLRSILEETGFPGQRLELEIAESHAMDSSPEHLERLQAIHDLGVSVAIDDFGMDNAFLGYLKDAPISRIKLHGGMAAKLPGSRKDLALVRAVAGMGAALDITVVCKGVESQEQCDALVRAGCRQGQGYLFAEPRSATELGTQLVAQVPPASV